MAARGLLFAGLSSSLFAAKATPVPCQVSSSDADNAWPVETANRSNNLEGHYFVPDMDYMIAGTCMTCADLVGVGTVCGGVIENSPKYALLECPAGQVCTNASSAEECPEGSYCPEGFTEPMPCSWAQICPAGSASRQPGLGAALLVAEILGATLAAWFAFTSVKTRIDQCALSKPEAEQGKDDQGVTQVGPVPSFRSALQQTTGQQNAASISIDFRNLSMTLRSNGQPILQGVSGSFPAGSSVAVMGPSGGGKTTFMNALCGRADYGKVSGDIFINGKPGGVDDFQSLVGFVPQDDILFADLTVFQALYFNALLRLPAAMPLEEKMQVVYSVLEILEIQHIQHSLIGDAAARGISGGQKKRVSIGLELVAAPRILFMDEPTSGLDGAAAMQLARCISRLGSAGITVVSVIHQPRYAVFSAFTQLLLLGQGGKTVYCGEVAAMRPYLESVGYRYPEGENTADWMIDVVVGECDKYNGNSLDKTFVVPEGLFQLWDDKVKAGAGLAQPIEGAALTQRQTPNFGQQFVIMFRRCCVQFRLPFLLSTMTVFGICGYLGGLLGGWDLITQFFGKYIGAFHNTAASLFVTVAAFPGYVLFASEQLPFMRERSVGINMPAYFFAKNSFNILDVVIPTFVFVCGVWLFSFPIMPFGDIVLIYMGLSIYCSSMGVLIGTMFSGTAGLLITVIVPGQLFSFFNGTLFPLSDLDEFSWWLTHACPGIWFMEAVIFSTFRQWPEAMQANDQLRMINLNLNDQGFMDRFEAGWGAGTYFLILTVLGLCFRFLAFLVMYGVFGKCKCGGGGGGGGGQKQGTATNQELGAPLREVEMA